MIERGVGYPVALIPGIQGRWEWMAPTVDALTAGHRVLSWSLTELRPERERDGTFLAWMRALDQAFDRAHERKLSLIGVSFGGLIAACYAARRPERVSALILVSTPEPVWRPGAGDALCLRFPRLALPYFGARAIARLAPEIHAARDSWRQRGRLWLDYAARGISAPFAPAHAAQWVREWQGYDITNECRRITAPTLLITGESSLDRVVPVERTREYLRLIPRATHATLPGTGHIGLITRPHRFAELAGQFIYTVNTAERNAPQVEERARHAS
jgi:pimeloyl-ACP methyl ester carboxylesterase